MTLAAHADPLTDAETQARQLQAEVSKLQLQVEQASERYDGAQASLVQLVITQEQATRAATAATEAVDHARAVADTTTRALYMSGGITGLYASVLTGQNPGQLQAGLHSVQVVSDADTDALATVGATLASGCGGECSGRQLAHQAGRVDRPGRERDRPTRKTRWPKSRRRFRVRRPRLSRWSSNSRPKSLPRSGRTRRSDTGRCPARRGCRRSRRHRRRQPDRAPGD